MLVLIGAKALAARDRASILAAAVAGAVAGAWWFALRVLVDVGSPQVKELGRPIEGVLVNAGMWWRGHELQAAGTVVASVVLLLFAVLRRRGHPLLAPLVGWMVLSTFVDPNVLGLDHNGSRTMAPALVLGLLVAVTPLQPRDASPGEASVSRRHREYLP